jgi:hypothetical protein
MFVRANRPRRHNAGLAVTEMLVERKAPPRPLFADAVRGRPQES